MKHRLGTLSLTALLTLVLLPHAALAQLSSTNYQMDVFGVGETSAGAGSSANFQTDSTIGPNFIYDTVIDTDGDGIPDSTESANGTNPNDPNDPTANGAGDDDGDGVTNAVEVLIGGNSTSTTATQDTDGDGVPDVIEVAQGTDWLDPNDPVASGGNDSDGDGVTDAVESAICAAYPSLASCPDPSATDDSDGDGIPDVTEFLNGYDPTDSNNPTANGAADTDSDGIPNGLEVFNGTDPNDEDDPTPQNSGGGSGGGSSSSSNNDDHNDAGDTISDAEDTSANPENVPEAAPTTEPQTPVVVPTTFEAPQAEVGVTEQEQSELAIVRSNIEALLSAEDASTDQDKLVLVIDRKVYALLPDENGAYDVAAAFDSGGRVSITVPAGSLGDEYEGAISIIITQQNLDENKRPARSHEPNLLGKYLYDIRVFSAAGTELTSFNLPLEIVIVVPEELQGKEGLGVYFINEDSQLWERVPDVRFVEREAIFTIDHLTTFAVWATADTPNEMLFDSSDQQTAEDEGPAGSGLVTDETGAQTGSFSWWWLLPLLILIIFFVVARRRDDEESVSRE